MMCVVTKDFLGAGVNYVRNQLIDGAVFRNEQVLISQRFLRPATQVDLDQAEEVEVDEPARPVAPPKKKSSGLKARVAKKR